MTTNLSFLPKDIENIINGYVQELTTAEKYSKVLEELKTIKKIYIRTYFCKIKNGTTAYIQYGKQSICPNCCVCCGEIQMEGFNSRCACPRAYLIGEDSDSEEE